jgi:hypothetical protein
MKNNQWKIVFIAGLLTVLAFINLSCLSWSLFPGEFTPSNHFFSDLGVNLLNPRGAIYYKLALILSGIGLYFFFWGLNCWYEETKNAILNNVIGTLASLFLLAKGLKIIDLPFSFYIGIAFLCIGKSLWKHPKMPKWLPIFSIAAGFITILFYFFNSLWMSWVTTLSWLLFVLFFSFRTKKAFGY